MKQERKDEIERTFLFKKGLSKEKLKELNIQETIFLIYSANYFKEKHAFINDDYDEKIRLFRSVLIDKIKTAQELFIAYDQNTDYPYIDGEDRVWIFSKEEFALSAKDYFLQQLVMLEIKKINLEDVIMTFAHFHRLGIKKILMDNGEYTTEINRDDVLPAPDWSDTPMINIPVENSALQHAMIRFFQTLYSKGNYDGKEQLLHQLENRMIDEVINAKFLIPLQLKEEVESIPNDEGIVTLKEGTTMQFASLIGDNETNWQPAFTDWTEFLKVYDKNIWKSNITTYDDLLALFQKMDGIVINCKGIALRINEKNKLMIENYIEEKNNPKKASVKKCIVEKDTKVKIGEPKDYPTKMIEAVKEYMKGQKCIKKAYLRLMIKDSEKSYLMVIDFEGKRDKIFKAIADVAFPYLNGMYLDMVEIDGWAKNVVKDVSPFYVKTL